MYVSAASLAPTSSNKNRKVLWLKASSMKQEFSLPDFVIYHITKNPSSPELYSKLIKSCKYFFEKNPIITLAYIHDRGESSLEICDKKHCIKKDIAKLKNKIWLTNELRISTFNSNVTSLLIPKLYRCETAQLTLTCSNIDIKDFQLLASVFQNFDLYTFINSDDGSVVMLEKILECIPNVKKFKYLFPYNALPAITVSTMENILQLNNLANLKIFKLSSIPEVMNINDINEFMKRQKDTKFCLQFSLNISDGYKNQLDELIDGIITSGVRSRIIFFWGQNSKKMKIMQSRYCH